MFGRNRKEEGGELAPVTTSEELYEALVTDYDAERERAGRYSFEVAWKSASSAQKIVASYAPVPELGNIAYFSAPLVESPTEQVVRAVLDRAADLLDGDIVVDSTTLSLRIAVRMEGLTVGRLRRVLSQFAAGAYAIREDFEHDETASPTLTFGH